MVFNKVHGLPISIKLENHDTQNFHKTVSYSLSLRKTALILKEVHDISISHQTIANYAQAASNLLNCWLDDFQYDTLSNDHCGDETYVKIKGKNAYVFFMCDSIKKIITSFNILISLRSESGVLCNFLYNSNCV